jgi:hypothetical protein
MGLGLGQQWASNPNLSYGGSAEHSLFSTLDPIGNAITKVGGDPLNLYGNKNNPSALLFPSPNASANGSAVPAVLPTLPGLADPMFRGGSFGGYANLGPGSFNAMAAQDAGPVYRSGGVSFPSAVSGQKPGPAYGGSGLALGRTLTPQIVPRIKP